jgi:hypothetical protein
MSELSDKIFTNLDVVHNMVAGHVLDVILRTKDGATQWASLVSWNIKSISCVS